MSKARIMAMVAIILCVSAAIVCVAGADDSKADAAASIVFTDNGGSYTDPVTKEVTNFETIYDANDSKIDAGILIQTDKVVVDKALALKKNVTIDAGYTLTLGANLTVSADTTLTISSNAILSVGLNTVKNDGSIVNNGNIDVRGNFSATVTGSGTVTAQPYFLMNDTATYTNATGTVTHGAGSDKVTVTEKTGVTATYKVTAQATALNDWSKAGSMTLDSVVFEDNATTVYVPSYFVQKVTLR